MSYSKKSFTSLVKHSQLHYLSAYETVVSRVHDSRMAPRSGHVNNHA